MKKFSKILNQINNKPKCYAHYYKDFNKRCDCYDKCKYTPPPAIIQPISIENKYSSNLSIYYLEEKELVA